VTVVKIKMNTTMASPTLGTARAGEIIDLPEEDARALLEGGSVVQTGDREFRTEPAAALVDPSLETTANRLSRINELGALRHLRPR
jgi:hypothetical protein